MAQATAAAGTVMVVSSNAGTPFADIAATGVRWWLQAYLPADRTLAEPMLARAVDAGAEAIVLTVDTPVVGTKYAAGDRSSGTWSTRAAPGQLRSGLRGRSPAPRRPPTSARTTSSGSPSTPGCLSSRRACCDPTTPAAASKPAPRAVWVSNHGGRQLDRAASTAPASPTSSTAVDGRAQVYVDGGIRSGLDVLAALALGADAVFLGRLPLCALVDGEAGVARLHADLREETVEAFRLAGCRTVADARGIAVQRGLRRLGTVPENRRPAARPGQEDRRRRSRQGRREGAPKGRPPRTGVRSGAGRAGPPPRAGASRRAPRSRRPTTARTCPRTSPATSSTAR